MKKKLEIWEKLITSKFYKKLHALYACGNYHGDLHSAKSKAVYEKVFRKN